MTDDASALEALFELAAATERLRQTVARQLGLSETDMLAVAALSRHGTLTASELARALGVTPGAVTAIADRLVGAGLARRTRGTTDRRRITVRLTADGHRTAEQLHDRIQEGFAGLEPDAVRAACDTMLTISSRLSQFVGDLADAGSVNGVDGIGAHAEPDGEVPGTA